MSSNQPNVVVWLRNCNARQHTCTHEYQITTNLKGEDTTVRGDSLSFKIRHHTPLSWAMFIAQ